MTDLQAEILPWLILIGAIPCVGIVVEQWIRWRGDK